MPPPILQLRQLIAECASRVSPTKAKELETFAETHDLLLEFTDDLGFRIRVRLDNNTIKLPIGSLNYLWCATNLFVTLNNCYVEAHEKKLEVFDTGSDPRSSAAIELFNWARAALRTGDGSWPEGGAVPSLNYEHGSHVHAVIELFLCALAWIIHHERAHVELEHKGNQSLDSLQEEIQADRSATEWVLEDCNDELERQKRALGISIATLSMALLDDPRAAVPVATTHPPDLERLYENIKLAKLGPDNLVYSFCIVVLLFCVEQSKVTSVPDEGVDTTHCEVYEDLLVQFQLRNR